MWAGGRGGGGWGRGGGGGRGGQPAYGGGAGRIRAVFATVAGAAGAAGDFSVRPIIHFPKEEIVYRKCWRIRERGILVRASWQALFCSNSGKVVAPIGGGVGGARLC